MKIIKIFLIEDNISYRIDLKNQIVKYFDNNNLRLKFDITLINNYNNFFETITKNSIDDTDIFIIDIELNTYFSGIDLSKKIREYNEICKIIFLTSHSEKAIDAINQKISPAAYLLKSDDLEMLQFQIIDLFEILMLDSPTHNNMLILPSHTKDIILYYPEILYISHMNGFRNQVLIQTIDTQIIIKTTLTKLKQLLPSPPFYLNFKSIIINCNSISSLSSLNEIIIFKNDIELELSSKLIKKLVNFQKGMQ